VGINMKRVKVVWELPDNIYHGHVIELVTHGSFRVTDLAKYITETKVEEM